MVGLTDPEVEKKLNERDVTLVPTFRGGIVVFSLCEGEKAVAMLKMYRHPGDEVFVQQLLETFLGEKS